MAIDGADGMFRVQDTSGNILYTRNGQFHADKDNYIVNAQGQRLTGYDATGTNIVPIKVPTGNIRPQPTGSVDFTTNLHANSPVITTAPVFAAADTRNSTPQPHMPPYESQGNEPQ